jgi:hypothetical protein
VRALILDKSSYRYMHVSRIDLEKLVVGHGSDLADIQAHLQECQDCQNEMAASLETEGTSDARVKILDPITSLGPSGPAHVLSASSTGLHVKVYRLVFVGAMVQVRSSIGNVFGRVRYCFPVGSGFQIGVKIRKAA